jgi:hypothetical protein
MPASGHRFPLLLYTYILNRWWRAVLAIGILLLVMAAGLRFVPQYVPRAHFLQLEAGVLWAVGGIGTVAIFAGAGLVEPASENVVIGVPEAGRVEAVLVTKGQTVKAGATTILLGGTIKDDKALAGVLYFAPKLDWVLGGSDLVGREVRLSQVLIVPPLKAGPFEIIVILFDKGGNLGTATLKMRVE